MSWRKAGLVTLADKGYQGSTWAKVPYKGKNKPEPRKAANRAHVRLRALGERANAQLKVWKILTKAPLLPVARRETRESNPRCTSAKPNQVGNSSMSEWIRPFFP